MFLVYKDEKGKKFKGFPYSEQDASKLYLTHFENLLFLEFIFKNSNNFIEKRQAEKEIEIAKRKMDYWKRHPNWNKNVVELKISELKKQWDPFKRF